MDVSINKQSDVSRYTGYFLPSKTACMSLSRSDLMPHLMSDYNRTITLFSGVWTTAISIQTRVESIESCGFIIVLATSGVHIIVRFHQSENGKPV